MARGDYHRWNAKSTTAAYHSISLAAMKRHKALSTGRHSWGWSRNGKSTGYINFDLTEDSITFLYSTKDRDGNSLDVNQSVQLTRTRPNYGGLRTWFLCGCGRRVATLYIHRQHVVCRHCLKLTYLSRNDGCPINRMWRKIEKLEAKLKDDRYRPKGMHNKTYLRLQWELAGAHNRKDAAFCSEAAQRFPWML